jgi:nucleoside recognition membrane protein YjiH
LEVADQVAKTMQMSIKDFIIKILTNNQMLGMKNSFIHYLQSDQEVSKRNK